MDQRYVRLADLTNGSGTFTVPGPATANLAPPGYYMLYVIDQNGVPFVSATVHVLPEPLKVLEARKAGSGSIQLFWSLNFANATVQTTDSLRPPSTWVAQPGTPDDSAGPLYDDPNRDIEPGLLSTCFAVKKRFGLRSFDALHWIVA